MKRLILAFILGLCVFSARADVNVLRSIQFEPCNGEAVYIFIMTDGRTIAFGLDYVTKNDKALAMFLSLLRNEEKFAKGKTLTLKQECEKKGTDI